MKQKCKDFKWTFSILTNNLLEIFHPSDLYLYIFKYYISEFTATVFLIMENIFIQLPQMKLSLFIKYRHIKNNLSLQITKKNCFPILNKFLWRASLKNTWPRLQYTQYIYF